MSTIDSWCQFQDFSWRWAVDSQKIKFLNKNSISSAEKTQTSLAKVFACMRQDLEPISLSDSNVHNKLFKFREVVEERYSRYCKSYCLFVRIWEIFMSIFPGRISTWSEHKKLLRLIDLKLGLIDHMGMPTVDFNAFALITPIQKQLDNWKLECQLKTPCKVMAAIVIRQGDNVLYRIHDTENLDAQQTHFDCSYNNPSDDPNQFFEFMSSCLKKMPSVVKGVPSGELKIDMEIVRFTKLGSDRMKILAIQDKVVVDGSTSVSSRKLGYNSEPTFDNYQKESLFLMSREIGLKNLKLPPTILDANNNFC